MLLGRKKRSFWITWGMMLICVAAICIDWTRTPQRQLSVPIYEAVVMRPYRSLVHPFITPFVRCRYRPTCSQYSVEAVRRFGLPVGLWLTTRRIFRCMPWVPFGTSDPVPPAKPRQIHA